MFVVVVVFVVVVFVLKTNSWSTSNITTLEECNVKPHVVLIIEQVPECTYVDTLTSMGLLPQLRFNFCDYNILVVPGIAVSETDSGQVCKDSGRIREKVGPCKEDHGVSRTSQELSDTGVCGQANSLSPAFMAELSD